MNHCWAGGLVPPQKCMHQEAVNPPPPSICLRLLFPAKQTTRFPMRASQPPHSVLSGHALHTARWKQLKHHFLKGVFVRRGEQGSDSAQLLAQNQWVCYKSACRSCLTFFWMNALIHSTDEQLCSDLILIHLLIHASKPTIRGEVEKEWKLP